MQRDKFHDTSITSEPVKLGFKLYMKSIIVNRREKKNMQFGGMTKALIGVF